LLCPSTMLGTEVEAITSWRDGGYVAVIESAVRGG
jgi:hypothetical protein